MVVGIQLPDGQIQGHYVEVVDSTELSYFSLRLVEEGVAQKAMVMLQQIGSASSLGILVRPGIPFRDPPDRSGDHSPAYLPHPSRP